MPRKKRFLMVGRHYTIEPLGLLHHMGLAESEGWKPEIFLVEGTDFSPLPEIIQKFKPDLVGFSIWTGYHLQAFVACDMVRQMGTPVVIGGPHATYFSEECIKHADYVIKGSSFRNFRRLLLGELLPKRVCSKEELLKDKGEIAPGIYFDEKRMAEGFPAPSRDVVYKRYPDYAQSPIKSFIASDGCPYECSYCYAPAFNEMYGKFELNMRPVKQIIEELKAIQDHYPLDLLYAQDDVFGFDVDWLEEFTPEMRNLNIRWHNQIRLELTRGHDGDKRLDLFREAGCTGITLAIESGNSFLRQHVLKRGMADELIIQGIQKIKDRGFTLRTEQILAVPFSDIRTDLETARLNCTLGPEMAWTSILVPYLGTSMGAISKQLGFYLGNNDDLKDTFFERSVLSHVKGGPGAIEEIVKSVANPKSSKDRPLQRMYIKRDGLYGDVYLHQGKETKIVGRIEYLDQSANDRYNDQTVMLQRVFDWVTKVPNGYVLAARFVELEKSAWTWRRLGEMTREHLDRSGYHEQAEKWEHEFSNDMGCEFPDQLPGGVRENPFYFVFLPSGPKLARKLLANGTFDMPEEETFRRVGRDTRHHLYDHWLYQVADDIEPPIAKA